MKVISRIETKYELDARSATALARVVERHLPRLEYREGFPSTIITTAYFDTDRFHLFRRAVRSHSNNLKVRVREYSYRAENGLEIVQPFCFLEVKRRVRGTVVKRRLRVPKSRVGAMLDGEDVWSDVVAIEAEDPFADRATDQNSDERIREFFATNRLYPKSIVEYRRAAYQTDERQLRITFDDELCVVSPPSRLYDATDRLRAEHDLVVSRRANTAIMEVKSQGEYPDWLKAGLRDFVPCHISKFAVSIQALATGGP